MNGEPYPSQQLWTLVNDYCNDAVDQTETDELEQLLRKDAAHRECFLDVCQLHADLYKVMRARRAVQNAVSLIQGLAAGNAENVPPGELTALSEEPAQGVRPGQTELPAPRWLSRSEVLRLSMAVAVSLLIAGFVMFLLRPQPQPLQRAVPVEITATDPVQEEADSPLAIVARDQNVRWSPRVAPRVGEEIRPGEMLKIDSGVIELKLASGVRIALEGPAEWAIEDESLATLESGKLVAHVPAQARGFTLNTPSARIVDLGTEFGVVVRDQQTDVAVFQGEVDVFAGDSASKPPAAGQGESGHRLSRGMSVQVRRPSAGDPVAVRSTPFDQAPFTEALAYARMVEDASQRVIAYQVPVEFEVPVANYQALDLSLGMDFDVLSPIQVTRLGVYDWHLDGVQGSTKLVVELWQRDDGGTPGRPKDDRGVRVLARQTFTSETTAELIDSSRFLVLAKPVRLEVGAYTIVAHGFDEQNRSVNSGIAKPPWTAHHGNRRIQFVGSSRYGTLGEFPLTVDTGPPNQYAAGTFEFVPADTD